MQTIDNARLLRAAQRANEMLEARTRDLRQAIATLHGRVLERERTEDALCQGQELETVGQLTGAMRHCGGLDGEAGLKRNAHRLTAV